MVQHFFSQPLVYCLCPMLSQRPYLMRSYAAHAVPLGKQEMQLTGHRTPKPDEVN